MLKKTLSVLLSLVMILGVIAVLPVTASAAQADEPVVTQVSGETDADADLEAQLDEADAEWEREHGDLADTGAAADIADTGAIVFHYNSSGDLVDNNDYEVHEVGSSITEYVSTTYSSVGTGSYSSSTNTGVVKGNGSDTAGSGRARFYLLAVGVGTCKVTCYAKSFKMGASHYNPVTKLFEFDDPIIETDSKSFYYRIVEKGKAVAGTYNAGSSGGSSSGGSSSSNLSTPKITGCESLDSGVNIKWNAVSGAARYRVYYKGGNGWTKMGSTTSTSFVDKDVKSGGRYTYTVRCVNAADTAFTSDFDNKGFVYTYNMATPQITSMTSSTSGVKITWSAVKNAQRYRVYYKNAKGSWVNMKELTGTSYLDSDVRFGKPYTYTVRCVKSDSSRFTSDFNGTGWRHTHYLDTPQITGCESSATGVTVNWKAVSGAQKYRVYYKNSKGSWTKMGETTDTSFLDDDVRTGKPYTYTVRCINNNLDTFMSDYDGTGYRYTYDPQLPTPKITTAEAEEDGVYLSWEYVPDEVVYRVYYKSADGWTRIGDTYDNSFTDTTIAPGETRTYTVRCRTNNNKDFASDFDRTGKTVKFTHVPQLLNAYYDSSDSSMYVYIDDPYNDCDNYGIWVKEGSKLTYLGDAYGTGGSWLFDITNLQSGKTYTFIVRGYDAQNRPITDYDANGFTFTI